MHALFAWDDFNNKFLFWNETYAFQLFIKKVKSNKMEYLKKSMLKQ
jgi:hypothetical protein